VPALLNYTAGLEAMQAASAGAEIRTIVTSRAFVEQAKLGDKLAGLQGIQLIYLEDVREKIGLGDKLWLMLYAIHFPRTCEIKTSPEAAAVVLFTSGSEGKPKGVVLPHRAILANIAQIRAVIDFSVYDKVLNALPIFHSFGLTAGALLPVLNGASLFLYPSPLHYRVIPELAYDRGCTVLFGTSTFLANYAKFANPYDFYRLRYVVAGAEKLSESVRSQWFEKFGLRIFEGYGATETAPVLAVNTPMAYKTGTVGNLLPGIEHRLVPVPGIANGGILHVRGPNVMAGYLKSDQPGVLQPPISVTAGTKPVTWLNWMTMASSKSLAGSNALPRLPAKWSASKWSKNWQQRPRRTRCTPFPASRMRARARRWFCSRPIASFPANSYSPKPARLACRNWLSRARFSALKPCHCWARARLITSRSSVWRKGFKHERPIRTVENPALCPVFRDTISRCLQRQSVQKCADCPAHVSVGAMD
jgi:acyl-CoA synthetase (AMP-forming)/AMP-acid ligase II